LGWAQPLSRVEEGPTLISMVLFFLIDLVVVVGQVVKSIQLVEECDFLLKRWGLHLFLLVFKSRN
jgi:hypothetical protein